MSWTRWIVVVMAATALAFGAKAVVGTPEPEPATAITESMDTDETSRLIGVFERRLEERTDYPDLAALGGLYLTRARTSGTLDDYRAAQGVFTEAVALAPGTPDALVGLAQADLALHDFASAGDGAKQALDLDPTAYGALTVVFDAALNQGEVAKAQQTLSALESAAGDDPAYSIRAAELSWVMGETDDAIDHAATARMDAAQRSLDAATMAIFEAYEAKILIDTGRYQGAIEALESAGSEAPNLFQRGRALAGIGNTAGAIAALEQAVAIRPNPAFLVELDKLYQAVGDDGGVAEIDATIEAIAALDESGVYNRVIARWLADRDLDSTRALELATADQRDDPYGHDIRAWTLYRNGRLQEARREADLAQEYGTHDATIAYHSGVIWAALGEGERAASDLREALEWSPRFDPVHADLALALLQEVGG